MLEVVRNVAKRIPGARGARAGVREVEGARHARAGYAFGAALPPRAGQPFPADHGNPLLTYFDALDDGPGIFKPRHYFDVYHRHFAKFVGRPVNIVEIGVYSGGSLGMWQHYFGPQCRVYGVDIEEECRRHESDAVKIFIGDQADPEFWKDFCREVPDVDIVVDDGGHLVHQQVPTLEALLPHLRDGGVFVCEDIGGTANPFQAYVGGLARNIHSTSTGDALTGFQQTVASVHLYPFMAVLEKPDPPLAEWQVEYRGSDWAAFELPSQAGGGLRPDSAA